MADQHNDNIPAVGNQITADVADIKENLEFHKDCFEALCDGWSNSATTNLRLKAVSLYNLFTMLTRPAFSKGSSAYTVDMTGGEYWCKDKFCYWDSALTTAAIGTPSADTWYYLYLDYSAITTNVEITNSEFAWSTTAPTWDNGYKQWLNSDDRCIFAVKTNGTPDDILDFTHDGTGLVFFDAGVEDRAIADLDTTWTNVTLSIPDFGAYRALIGIMCDTSSSTITLYWRPDGTSITGLPICRPAGAGEVRLATVQTSSSQIIEIKNSVSDATTAGVNTMGWYFPRGM